MILNRLFELAERENLLDDPAFEEQPIAYLIVLKENGDYKAIDDVRDKISIPSRKKGAPGKTRLGKGKRIKVPVAHGNTANSGFARYFADTLERVLPVSDEPKSVKSRRTFWEQLDRAAVETNDPALRAAQAFGKKVISDGNLQAQVRADLERKEPIPGERCTFAWEPDAGKAVVERDPIRAWYCQFFAAVSGKKQQAGNQGLCQITREIGPLANSHATRISGVPGGLPQGVYIVSNDKAAFESYALDGAVNAGIGYRAAEGYARALNGLIANKLFHGKRTSLKVSNTLFVYWTRRPGEEDYLTSLDSADPEEVRLLIESVERGRPVATADPNELYCLCLSGNSARAIVRDYLEVPVATLRYSLGRWFQDLRVVDDTARGQGQPNASFPLWMLAAATVRDGDAVAPGLPQLLLSAALRNQAVPESVLAACLQRVRLDPGATQFRPARMGLIRLILNRNPARGDLLMTESLDPTLAERSQAYACGRLLAFLARCQKPRSFGADAQILERFFGSASTAPRSVFPLLLRLNRHHLKQVRDDNPGFASNLETELEERLAPFGPTPDHGANFPPLLSLVEQGQFALGFYLQRADYRKQSAEKKAAKEAASLEEASE